MAIESTAAPQAGYLRRRVWRDNRFTLVVGAVVVITALSVSSFLGVGSATSLPWSKSHTVAVWIKLDATHAQVTAIRMELSSNPAVKECGYRSQLADYQQAKTLLPTSEFARLSVQTTPASFQCRLQQPEQRGNLVKSFRGLPGVLNVTVPSPGIRSS